ncbi:hypothetical protein [Nonomuraea sp. NPDC002799]
MAESLWGDAIDHAEQLMQQCIEILEASGLQKAEHVETSPFDVKIDHLKERVGDGEQPDRFESWLCAQLQRMGHRVNRPVAIRAGGVAEITQTLTKFAFDQAANEQGEDPAVRTWYRGTIMDGRVVEHADGTVRGTLRYQHFSALYRIIKTMDRALDLEQSIRFD